MTGRATRPSGPGGLAPPGLTLALVVLILAVYLWTGPAPSACVFDRTAIIQGEWWRLVTGHLAHSGIEHLFWNLAALLLIGWMLEGRDRALLAWGLVAGTAAVDGWLWIGLPELQRYCGLSGVLNTLMLLLVWQLWRETREPWVVALAAASLVKLIMELHSGHALLTHTAWPSVPSAHLGGLCGGIALLAFRWLLSQSGERDAGHPSASPLRAAHSTGGAQSSFGCRP